MINIKNITARQVFDSRGIPTIEAEVILNNGIKGRGIVPSGVSVGNHEALELRDGDNAFMGKSVHNAVNNVKEILKPMLLGTSIFDQMLIDDIMINSDNTPNKSKIGANAILAVSLASAYAAAKASNVPLYSYLNSIFNKKESFTLPVPLINVINGGLHANNSLDIQEFMIIPEGASSFSEALSYSTEIFQALKCILQRKHLTTAVGDEGGFAPDLSSNTEALDLIMDSIIHVGLKPGIDVSLALDMAMNDFFYEGQYKVKSYVMQNYSSKELIDYLVNLLKQYPIVSIEDPLSENDWQGWIDITTLLNGKVQLVGDDLFVTNAIKLQKGIDQSVANAILIKMNQIGTLSETFETIKLAQASKYNTIISHRSGETEDVTIAHLAVATNAKQIKTGSLCRSERVAKYNELLRIEESLGSNAKFIDYKSIKC